MKNDEHEYYDDITPEELYGEDQSSKDYLITNTEQKSFIPKYGEEKYEEKETVLTMELKFIDGKLHQKIQEITYVVGLETAYIYTQHSQEKWKEVPSENSEKN